MDKNNLTHTKWNIKWLKKWLKIFLKYILTKYRNNVNITLADKERTLATE